MPELRDFNESSEDRMNIHKNARLTPRGRELIARQIESAQRPGAPREPLASARTARKWHARFNAEGGAGKCSLQAAGERLAFYDRAACGPAGNLPDLLTRKVCLVDLIRACGRPGSSGLPNRKEGPTCGPRRHAE